MPGATMTKLRGNYAVRAPRKAKLLPARPYSMKAARVPELRLALVRDLLLILYMLSYQLMLTRKYVCQQQHVSRQHRRQVPRSPVELELGELAEEFEQISSFWPVHRSPRRRARPHAALPRNIKPNHENRDMVSQQQSQLPESTWCLIQDMITNAKSLGDM